jgi:peroxiredoxin
MYPSFRHESVWILRQGRTSGGRLEGAVHHAINQNSEPVDFAKVYAKSTTLVYFYPKAGTPGCTAQACSLRDSFADLSEEGLQILGVSGDSPESQKSSSKKTIFHFR